MSGGQLDRLLAELPLDHQVAAVIAVGVGEEECRGEIAADAEVAAAPDADGVVDMRVE